MLRMNVERTLEASCIPEGSRSFQKTPLAKLARAGVWNEEMGMDSRDILEFTPTGPILFAFRRHK